MITKKQFLHSIQILITQTLVVLLFIGCTTSGYVSEDINGSISEIQKAVSENLPSGVGFVASNQRIFYSKEFTTTSGKVKTSSIMKIAIIGDRRPYALQIKVNEAADTKNVFEAFENGIELDSSETYARRTFDAIKAQLTKRLKNKNLFDDFRPF